MATAAVTDVDELNRLLRTIREGGEGAVSAIDALFGLDASAPEKAKYLRGGIKNVGKAVANIPGMDKKLVVDKTRMAMQALKNPALQTGLKYAPVVGAGLAAGDVLLGDESLGNKAMDVGLMTAGGIAGSASKLRARLRASVPLVVSSATASWPSQTHRRRSVADSGWGGHRGIGSGLVRSQEFA